MTPEQLKEHDEKAWQDQQALIETDQIVKYLRMSPKDSLKKSAADLIEQQALKLSAIIKIVS